MTQSDLFLQDCDINLEDANGLVKKALANSDDGELYWEYRQTESFSFDDNRLKNTNYDISRGFGLRNIVGEAMAYAHSSEISRTALQTMASAVSIAQTGQGGNFAVQPQNQNAPIARYRSDNPLQSMSFQDKLGLLQQTNDYIRAQNSLVSQVNIGLIGQWQSIMIMRADGQIFTDIRPLVRFNISVVVKKGSRQESGYHGMGGRVDYPTTLLNNNNGQGWQAAADEALRQALVNLDSVDTPAGEMEVVLAAGWPGILLHEAVGHGLEGDFNRKKSSAFSELMGKPVASDKVTVIDDGTLDNRRGSLTIDDEGTPSQCNTLIKDGTLVGYMQDRQNARLMGMEPTGNGRRESYAHPPMPRMTNTFMAPGTDKAEDIISSVKNGIYAVNFGGGQVDITSGKFVFSCTEAYKLENGQIKQPLKGATLIGSGPEALHHVTMVANDLKLDSGVGTCGKDGQGVPVGVGQPTMKLSKITVGGTA